MHYLKLHSLKKGMQKFNGKMLSRFEIKTFHMSSTSCRQTFLRQIRCIVGLTDHCYGDQNLLGGLGQQNWIKLNLI